MALRKSAKPKKQAEQTADTADEKQEAKTAGAAKGDVKATKKKPVRRARTAKPAVDLEPRPSLRRRARRSSSLDPLALVRAQNEAESGNASALADAADFDDVFPIAEAPAAPLAPAVPQTPAAPPPVDAQGRELRIGPAKLPDMDLIEKAKVNRALLRAKRNLAKMGGKKKKPVKPSALPLSRRLRDLVAASLKEAVDQRLGKTGSEFSLFAVNPVRVLLAYSGGPDSTALLDVLAKLFHEKNQSLIASVTAVYVNHGLSPNANRWAEHCRGECEKRKVGFASVRVRVNTSGEGVEAAAREVRYEALSKFATEHGCDVVMTAHHEDDRIETFLLQWMRGAGPEGLAAFPQVRELKVPSAVVEDDFSSDPAAEPGPLLLLRPWRQVMRREVMHYVKLKKLEYVEDESNADPKYARNRIRNEVVPLLESIRPGFKSAAARSVELVAEAADILRSVAKSDLEACRSPLVDGGIAIYKLLTLIPARQAWCLRAWMAENGMQAPGKARLEEALRQIRETNADTNFAIRIKKKEIRRWGSDLVVRDVAEPAANKTEVVQWDGSQAIALTQWAGEIEVIACGPDEAGIPAEALRQSPLTVSRRTNSLKLKLWHLRPSKTLKDLYAEAGIPAFERDALPVVSLGELPLFAAGLGMDVRRLVGPEEASERVRLRFRQTSNLWNDKAVPNYGDLPESVRREREKAVKEAAVEQRRAELAVDAAAKRSKANGLV